MSDLSLKVDPNNKSEDSLSQLLKSHFLFLFGQVFHSRKVICDNSFKYNIFNIFIDPFAEIELKKNFKFQFKKIINFDLRQHLYFKDNQNYQEQIKLFFLEKFNYHVETCRLQTLPLVFGYTFNPVSFWYLFKNEKLDAVLCEVNNTFGEKHLYWLHHDRNLNGVYLRSNKVFHVSPFFDREGFYEFKFNLNSKSIIAIINLFEAQNKPKILTFIKGNLKKGEDVSLFKVLLKYGWMTPLVVFRIHYQALILFFKKAKFYTKPQLNLPRFAGHQNLW